VRTDPIMITRGECREPRASRRSRISSAGDEKVVATTVRFALSTAVVLAVEVAIIGWLSSTLRPLWGLMATVADKLQ